MTVKCFLHFADMSDILDTTPVTEMEETQMKQMAIIENGRPVVNER